MHNTFRSALRLRLAAFTSALPLLFAGQAIADDEFGGGFFVGYSPSDKKFDWGVEIYNLGYTSCSTCEQQAALGPVARLTFQDMDAHLSLSLLMGSDLSGGTNAPSAGAEVGTVLSLSTGSLDFLSGVYVQARGFKMYARQNWLNAHHPIGFGVNFALLDNLGSKSEPDLVAGRVFRGASGEHQQAFSPSGTSSDLGQHWQSRALEECASIPAFLQLAAELLDLGAPNSLVRAALDAADDELRHTRMATYLARRFGSPDTNPIPPMYRRRPALPRREQLARLADESWIDGCLGESIAAAIAGAEARKSNDQELQLIQKRIYQDEDTHASLAWDVLQWVLNDDPSIAPSVQAERLRVLDASPSMVLSREETQDVLRHTHRQCRDRLHTLT